MWEIIYIYIYVYIYSTGDIKDQFSLEWSGLSPGLINLLR